MKSRNRSLSGDKRGNAIVDTITIMVLLFAFVVVVIIGRVVLSDVNTDIQADSDMDAGAKLVMSNLNTDYTEIFDYGIVVLYVFLWIFGMVASFLVDSHPAFMAVAIVLMLFTVFISATLANTYSELAQDPDIQAEAAFPKTTFLFQHFVEYFLVVCASIMIVLYGKQ